MASVFDRGNKKPGMVAEIMSGAKEVGRGVLSNVTGAIDFLGAGITTPFRMATKGEKFPEAYQKSSGMLTNAVGLEAPAANTPESYLYKIGQLATPMKNPTSVMNYAKQVAGNTAIEGAMQMADNNPAANLGIFGGLMAGSAGVNALRNKALRSYGFSPEALAQAKESGLTLGQQTGNRNALRVESEYAASSRADEVKDFYTKQSEDFAKLVSASSVVMPKEASNIKAVQSAFERISATYKGRQKAISDQYGKDLSDFYAKTGGGNRKFIPSDPMVAQIDELIASNKASVGSTGNEAVIKELEKIRKQLTDETGNPRKISGKEFKEQQTYWSQASSSSGSWLDGIAADRARPMAAQMAQAMDATFDAATTTFKGAGQIAALKKFQAAREQYRSAKTNMEEWASEPVNRYFDTDNVYSLKGDEIIAKIAKESPEGRAAAVKYLNYIAPELVDNIRKEMVDSLVSKGVVTGAAEGSSTFDPKKFLKGVEESMLNDKAMLSIMFPDTQQQQLFTKRLAEAKKMALTDSAPDMAFNTPGTKAAEDLASVAGNYKARIGVRGVVSGMQDATKSLLIGGDKLFDMLFKNKDITTKFKDTYLTRMGVKSAAISQDANNMSDEELQKAYQEYLQQQGGSTAPTMAPEPSVAPEPMTAPMEAPEASLDPSTMTDEQLQQLYMEYQQMQQQKPTDMAPTPIQGQQL
jgi:hypothetical protein